MRLICPNCDAHYEVDEALIPPAGRDVQCSDCGHVWFQDGAGEIITPDPDPETGAPETTPLRGQQPLEPAPAPDQEPDDDPDDGLRPLTQRSLDDTLLSVLREEAAREAEARAREASASVETQPELGLPEADAAPRRRIIVRAPSAPSLAAPGLEKTADLMPEPDSEDPAPRPSRRELLPDIEQINSTLRASDEPRSLGDGAGGDVHLPEPRQKRRRGFRIGFFGILAIASLALALYVGAAPLKTALPGLGPWLDSYVTQIDALRHELDRVLQNLLVKLEQSA